MAAPKTKNSNVKTGTSTKTPTKNTSTKNTAKKDPLFGFVTNFLIKSKAPNSVKNAWENHQKEFNKFAKDQEKKIAKMYGCNVYKILTWIRNGELKAINIATKLGGRPRYIVKREELEAFERRRQVQPPPPIVRRSSK